MPAELGLRVVDASREVDGERHDADLEACGGGALLAVEEEGGQQPQLQHTLVELNAALDSPLELGTQLKDAAVA